MMMSRVPAVRLGRIAPKVRSFSTDTRLIIKKVEMKRILATITCLLMLTACNGSTNSPDKREETVPEITLSAETVTIPEKGGTERVKVKVNTAWSIKTDQSWLTLSAKELYKGESILNLSAGENLTGTTREATVSLTSGKEKKELQVIQPCLVPELTLSSTKLELSGEAGSASVTTEANTTWTAETDGAFWLKISAKAIRSGSQEFTVTVLKNYSEEPRTAKVTFTSGSSKVGLEVIQAKGEPFADGAFVPEGYQLAWHDEFDGEKVDPDNWRFEDWAPGRVNHELQRYVAGGERDGKKTAFVEDGALNIRAMKHNGEVISARMNSKAAWKYGYMEARIWLPKGLGTWPAFWMMPTDQSLGWPKCGEIDILEEVGANPEYTSSSIHTESYNHVKNTQKTHEQLTEGAENEYHIYSCRWTAEALEFYVDGKLHLTFRNDGAGNVSTWPFDKEFFIILNLAWGGDWGGYKGIDESALPTTMKIDYVRVYQK